MSQQVKEPAPILGPLMTKYLEIKNELPEKTILLYRLGDFYEIFFEDAKTVAKILEIALTKRQGHLMCGIPYWGKDKYISELLKAGYKVAEYTGDQVITQNPTQPATATA